MNLTSTLSLAPSGGEGVRRTGEGDRDQFKVPMHPRKWKEALHEPYRFQEPGIHSAGGVQADWSPRSSGCSCRVNGPMHSKKRKRAFHEPHEFRSPALIKRRGGPPHARTLLDGRGRWAVRQVLDCASLLALWRGIGKGRNLVFWLVPLAGKSGKGLPHSKTLARWPPSRALRRRFRVRRPCGALDRADGFKFHNPNAGPGGR